jgi:hypothetical protein
VNQVDIEGAQAVENQQGSTMRDEACQSFTFSRRSDPWIRSQTKREQR